jgi:hypothetical protein
MDVSSEASGRGGDSLQDVRVQLELLNARMEDLSSFMLNPTKTVIAEDGMRQAYYEHNIDYSDVRPVVELGVDVLQVSDFDVASLTFKAKIRVTLDWEEKEFVEGIHYHFDRSQRPVLSEQLFEDENSFNPEIYIDNMIQSDDYHYTEPKRRIHRIVHHFSEEAEDPDADPDTMQKALTGTTTTVFNGDVSAYIGTMTFARRKLQSKHRGRPDYESM